jgi:hypothetical protein
VLVPLNGFVRGDTLGVLVLVHDHDTVAGAIACLSQAASVRVAPFPRATLYWKGEPLDPALTIAAVGLSALDRVDLLPETDA